MLVLRGHRRRVSCVAYAPDGQLLVSASKDGTLKLWDLAQGSERLTLHPPGEVHRVAFVGDNLLASAGTGVQLWDVTTGALAERVRQPEYGAYTFAASPTGRTLAFTHDRGGAGVIELWDCVTRRSRSLGRRGSYRVTALALAPNGWVLAAGEVSLHVRLWDTHKGEQVACLSVRGPKQGLVFSPDGETLAVLSGSDVWLWDVPTRQLRAVLGGQVRQVNSAAFTPDSRLLATASNDHTVKFWDVASGAPMRSWGVLDWQVGRVRTVAFAPDGMTAAAGGEDGRVAVWDVDGF